MLSVRFLGTGILTVKNSGCISRKKHCIAKSTLMRKPEAGYTGGCVSLGGDFNGLPIFVLPIF